MEQNNKSTLTKQPSYSPRVPPHKRADYRRTLKKISSLGSEQIQINGSEMFENFREFLENHTYLKAVKKSTREMLRHRIVQSVDLNAMKMFQMKADKVLFI